MYFLAQKCMCCEFLFANGGRKQDGLGDILETLVARAFETRHFAWILWLMEEAAIFVAMSEKLIDRDPKKYPGMERFDFMEQDKQKGDRFPRNTPLWFGFETYPLTLLNPGWSQETQHQED